VTAAIGQGTTRAEREPNSVARAVLSVLASRAAWVVVAVVVVVALAVGSVHPQRPSSAARIAYLDSVIKCPSCVDLSIAQSDAPIAVGLRGEVATWVHEGLSDARIEQLVVARFGEEVLLVPSGSGADILLWAVPVTVLGAAVVVLGLYLWRRRRLEDPA
jgi:cytochrome c-type biogenesis protein CcmH/NrfF